MAMISIEIGKKKYTLSGAIETQEKGTGDPKEEGKSGFGT